MPHETEISQRFGIMPAPTEWAGKILFIETSEERPAPLGYRQMLQHLQAFGVFDQVVAVVAGKPQNERYYAEYKQILQEVTAPDALPLLFNVNFGRAYPRTALPYGAKAALDCDAGTLTITEPFFT